MAKRIYKKVIAKRRFRKSINYLKPNPDNQYLPVYAEGFQHTQTNTASTQITYVSGQTYYNLATLLNVSSTFQNAMPLYARVKITAMEIFVTDASSSTTMESVYSPKVLPVCAFNFYVSKSGTAMGDTPLYGDDSLNYHSGIDSKGYKKWDFNKKHVDKSSLSVGQWIDPSVFSTFWGQLSLATYTPSSASTFVRVHNVRIRVTCLFSSRIN